MEHKTAPRNGTGYLWRHLVSASRKDFHLNRIKAVGDDAMTLLDGIAGILVVSPDRLATLEQRAVFICHQKEKEIVRYVGENFPAFTVFPQFFLP